MTVYFLLVHLYIGNNTVNAANGVYRFKSPNTF